jgi:hypothetical protein
MEKIQADYYFGHNLKKMKVNFAFLFFRSVLLLAVKHYSCCGCRSLRNQ